MISIDCKCAEGSRHKSCDDSGQCECKSNISGLKCNRCAPGYYDFENGCDKCADSYNNFHNGCKAGKLVYRI